MIERPSPRAIKSVERLRKLCAALPEVTERLSHGEPTWFVRGKKSFMNMSDHHHDDRVAFWCAGADGAQEVLVATQPEKYFRPPYVGHRGWIGVYLDVPGVDWDQIADLVVDAYRLVAPAKLVEQLETTGKSRSARKSRPASRSRSPKSRSAPGRTKAPSR